MNAMVNLQKLYTLQSRCYMSVNTTQLNMISSLEALVPWLSMGFCLWILNASLYNNIDQCLNLSIITVFSITVCIGRDGSLKGKVSRRFEFN